MPCRLLSVLLFAASASLAIAAERPNVVLIMTDDQGYGDLSLTGNEFIDTPAMDSLAADGAWAKHFYVSPVCTPTRANLMTGRYNFRTRAIDTYLGRAVMEPDEVTIAETLSDAGYATGIFGKWHLGDYYPTRPGDQGFAESLVHQGGGLRQPSNPPEGERYDDPILFHNGQPKRCEGYCTNIFFDEATRYIEEQAAADKPFFVYLPTNAPHAPYDEPPTRELMEEFAAKFPADNKGQDKAGFYAMIKNIDDNIARLLAKLDDLGIEEDTLVIFLTDNGPSAGSAGPFRGHKGNVYEGGIRTVCFLRWPGTIKAGSTISRTAAHIDLMPTILDLCGVQPPAGVALDGRSLRPLLSMPGLPARIDWPDRHLILQWHRGDEPIPYMHFAAIDPAGQWKLLNPTKPRRVRPGQKPRKTPDLTKSLELYDLRADPSETTNVIDEHPEVAARLRTAYDEWFADVSTTREPNFGMPPIPIGTSQQPTVVLTPQDKRVDAYDTDGWRTPGSWPVDIRDPGPYTIHVRLTGETDEETIVTLAVTSGGQTFETELTVHRGLDAASLGNVTLPAGGLGRVVARVRRTSDEAPYVHQVTIK